MQDQRCCISASSVYAVLVFLGFGFGFGFGLAFTPAAAHAQHLARPANLEAMEALPDAPGRSALTLPPDQQAPEPHSTATIGGTVLDINEGLVPNARIVLESPNGTEHTIETSDSAGNFLFKAVPPGSYKLRITAPGLETFISYVMTLHPGEHHQIPRIALPIAANTSDVTVTVTEDQIATEQIQAQIQQRALGVFPNFYTSFIWNPAPLKTKHKFYLAFRSTTDPVNFISTGIVASIQQARGTYKGYGDGPEGYGKRFGADYGNLVISRMVGGAILPSLFHQDPRYFYQGSGTTTSRALHAIGSTVITRGDNGHNQPNFSYVLGVFVAAGITNLYYPDDDRTAATIIENAFIRLGTHTAGNLVREFLLRGITHKVPSYAQGKPVTEAATRPEVKPAH